MNKITRKSFLKVLAATMVGGAAASALTGAAAPVSIDETNGKVSRWVKNSLNPDGPLTIAKQGIDNGPEDIMSTSFWRQVRDGALAFAAQYNADGGDCTVVDLPKIGITGNSHFMFQELNNKEIADHIYQWLESRALA